MPDRDWRKPLALGLSALVIVLVWAAYHLGSEISEARNQAENNARSYETHAADQIRRSCLNGEGSDLAECVSEIIRATNEHQRAEQDLIAQMEMSRWALYMLVVSVLVAGITGIGVYFVWLTLGETRRMANETRDIGVAQTRPWLSIEYNSTDVCLDLIDVKSGMGLGMSPKDGVIPAQNLRLQHGFGQGAVK